MAFVNWTDAYLVGVDRCDKEHQRLFGLINELFDCVKLRSPESDILRLFDELVGYTVEHFFAEEKMMKAMGYPQLAQHVAEHEAFKAEVIDLVNDYKSGNQEILLHILRRLSIWLSDHIGLVDKGYTKFIAEREKERGQFAKVI